MKMILGLTATVKNTDVTAEILLNNTTIAKNSADTEEFITEINLPETAQDHVVEIQMLGKNNRHTQIDDQGNIVYDVAFEVTTLEIEDIDVRPIFCQGRVCYTHNSNNPRNSEIQDEFYGYIGFNGRVRIEFSTPIYLWLLQHFDY
jgi:hypothetical protein